MRSTPDRNDHRRLCTGQRLGTVEIPGNTRYGMSTWMHEGKQYVIIQLADGLAAMALP